MSKLVCGVCGYVYDEDVEGPMPEDYECPVCGAGKDAFEEE